MAEKNANEAMQDYAIPRAEERRSAIVMPAIDVANFELPAMIQMIQDIVQFEGLPSEDPYAHIDNFLEFCNAFTYNEATEEAIRLRLFPFSLRDEAKSWLRSLPGGSITTWNDLTQKFLVRFFPLAKSAKLRSDIITFQQFDSESLCEAWKRFKKLLRKCPNHAILRWVQLHTFYNGLNESSRVMIDVAAGGALLAKTTKEAFELLELMVANRYQWPPHRSVSEKITGTHEGNGFTVLTAKLDTLSKKLDRFGVNSIQGQCITCQNCREGSSASKSSLEEIFMQYMAKTDAIIQSQTATIRALEIQVDQLANVINNCSLESLSSNTYKS